MAENSDRGVPEGMRIGELLLLQERIDPWVLSHTLKEQLTTGQRLISLLINRALIDPDEGTLALSDQLGYPAAMQRHLERRDPEVLKLLPPELGARWVVLPLRRIKTGAVVVVARDPTPILIAALSHAMKTEVVLAVTPSLQLERLVRAAYGATGDPEAPLPASPPSLSEIGEVQLDNAPAKPARRGRTVSHMMLPTIELATRTPLPIAELDTILDDVDRALTLLAAEHVVMTYAAKRWRTGMLMRIDDGRAVGVRGHGSQLKAPERISLTLAEPSMLTIACASKHATIETPDGATQTRLRWLLDAPNAPAAAPVIVANQVKSVLVVGDLLESSPGDSVADLDRLVDALGAAYARLDRD